MLPKVGQCFVFTREFLQMVEKIEFVFATKLEFPPRLNDLFWIRDTGDWFRIMFGENLNHELTIPPEMLAAAGRCPDRDFSRPTLPDPHADLQKQIDVLTDRLERNEKRWNRLFAVKPDIAEFLSRSAFGEDF